MRTSTNTEMESTLYKSADEINKVYQDHIDSLRVSGFPFDEAQVLFEWDRALAEFEETHPTIGL